MGLWGAPAQREITPPRIQRSPLERRVIQALRHLERLALTGVWIIFTKAFVVQIFQGDIIAQRRTAAGIPEIRYLYALSMLVVTGLALLHIREVQDRIRRIPLPLWGLAGYITLSVLWSLNPGESVMKTALFMTSTLAGILLSVYFSDARALTRWLMTTLLFLITASLFWAVFLPHLGTYTDFRGTTWIGVFNYKNVLGYVSATALLLALSAPDRGAWMGVRGFLGLFSATTLIFSRAAGAQVFTLTTLMAWVGWRFLRRARIQVLLGVGSFLTVGLLTLGVWAWLHLPTLLALMGREATLTNRIPLWGAIFWTLQRYGRLWIGAGQEAFFGGWASPTTRWVWRIVGWRPMQAHNGYVQTVADLGVLGLAVALGVWITAGVRAFQAYRRDRTWAFPLLLWTFLLQMNLTETLFTAASVYATMAFWALVIWMLVTTPPPGEAGALQEGGATPRASATCSTNQA